MIPNKGVRPLPRAAAPALLAACPAAAQPAPRSKDDVERCKQKDLLEQMMAEMIGEFPDLHRTIVSERDIYLTYMLRQAARRLELPRSSDGDGAGRPGGGSWELITGEWVLTRCSPHS